MLKALEMNSGHEVALKFLTWMLDKDLVPSSQAAAAKAALAANV